MDEEQLHNRLNAHITEVFDNYEDTTADEGWALLRQKFPEEKKDRGLFWLWYAAAAVVLLGIGLWFMQAPDQIKKQEAVNIKPVSKLVDTAKENPKNNSLQNTSEPTIATARQTPNTISTGGQSGRHQQVTSRVNSNIAKVAVNQSVRQTNNNASTGNSTGGGGTQPQSGNYIATNPVVTNPVAVSGSENMVKADSAQKPTQAIAESNVKSRVSKQPLTSAEAMAKLLAETAPLVRDKNQDKKTDKKATIGLFAATYFNYAKGSDNLVNVGAGISSDFRINNKLRLSTGLSIGQNTLNYDYSKQTGASYDAYADALPSRATALSSSAVSYTATPVNKNYKASLIGLDIPINIKYQFDPKKSDTYVSAGVSSGTFITETYVLDYTVAQQAEQSTVQSNFSNFYFAKTLNFSFGMGYAIGKSNRLIVEPFLKYPLDGLGVQQIKFGAGGINLKLNFSSPKKK